ncbi:MAG TPA: hypothetical protein VKE96_15755 [Vicinamibacterales bacterium]|nr:hypothetical protein [Vicinamibacterales bacterium]
MKHSSSSVLTVCAAALVLVAADRVFAADDQAPASSTPQPFEVVVYPILVQAPIFGAEIDLPSLPGGGGGGSSEGGEQTATSGTSLNSAYMAGVTFRADRWFGEFRGDWADLGASRESPRFDFDAKARVFNVRGGVRLFDGLFATGGFRRISVRLDMTLNLPILGRDISGTTEPVFYDPMIGVEWRQRAGNWIFDANFQGGGFGVGTDVDTSAEFHAGWRVIPHTEIRLGYTFLYYKLTVADVSIGSFQRTLISSQTLHGPIVGFGIVF